MFRGDHVNKGSNQGLVDKLIFLFHMRHGVAFALSLVS